MSSPNSPFPRPAAVLLASWREPDGNLWFTENGGDKIGRITTAGIITEFNIPTVPPAMRRASRQDRTVRFGLRENFDASAGRSGASRRPAPITEFPIPTANSHAPYGITTGPDGALWFTEHAGDKIGRITTGGAFAESPAPCGRKLPLWHHNGAGRRTMDSPNKAEKSAAPLPPVRISPNLTFLRPIADPFDITTGPDSALWFTES